MNKKLALTAIIGIVATNAALADGFYISPKIALGTTSVEESRTETKVIGGTWSEFAGNKHESWEGDKTQVDAKFAIGYDFNLDKYGIVSIEAEYGTSKNYFNGVGLDYDLDGLTPNDSDSRNFTYNEKTFSINAKYGYDVYNGVTPFVTAGIGHSTIESKNNFRSGTYWWETTDQEKNLSWNIGFGVAVPVTDNVSVTLAYTYTDLGSVEYANKMYHNTGATEGIERVFKSDVDLSKQEIVAGLKIAF